MLLTKLTVRNFKRFKDETEFDLEIKNKNENIILVEALNGVGKTSLLQAIQWAFFWLDPSEYRKYLNYEAINKEDFNLELSIEYRDNEFNDCRINRKYTSSDQNTVPNEKLELFIWSQKQDFTPEVWDDYLNKNFPREISNFFFFDGEKLQYLIDPKDQKKVKSAIEKILWVETIRNLRTNLVDLKSNALRDVESDGSDQKMKLKNVQLAEKESQKKIAQEKLEENNSSLNEILWKKKLTEESLLNLQKMWLDKEKMSERDQLIKRKWEIESEILKLDNEINDFKWQFLDRFLFSGLTPALKAKIDSENDIKQTLKLGSLDNSVVNTIIEALYVPVCLIWWEKIDENDKEIIRKQLQEKISSKIHQNWELILDLNNKSTLAVDTFIKDIEKADWIKINDLIDKKIALINSQDFNSRKIEDIDNELRIWPDSNNFEQIYQESIDLNKKQQKLEMIIQELELELSEIDKEIQKLQKDIELIMQQSSWSWEVRKYLNTLNKLNDVFDEHIRTLASNTKKRLEVETFKMFQLLSNRPKMYSKIEISDDYEVKILDSNWDYQENLNSGDMQILMTSMLWGLEQLSEFKLPIIIDTPLARLDPIHRKNMIEKYFFKAWAQVIILSQPSEITDLDKQNVLFSEHLRDKSYMRLNFDQKSMNSSVEYITNN